MPKKLTGCFIILGLAILCLSCAFVLMMRNIGDRKELGIQNTETQTIMITGMSTYAQQWIGRVLSLSVKVKSNLNEPYVELKIVLPDQVKLVEGDLTWRGALTANEEKACQVSVCALAEGNWLILAQAQAWRDENYTNVKTGVTKTIELHSTNNTSDGSCP